MATKKSTSLSLTAQGTTMTEATAGPNDIANPSLRIIKKAQCPKLVDADRKLTQL
jgi:hypothetical protein